MVNEINDNNVAGIIKENPICCIKMWAEWCGPCKGIVQAYEDLSEEVDAEVIMCSMTVDENPDFTDSQGIKSIPAILVFINGERKEIFNGSTAVQSLSEYLKTNPLNI